MRWVGIGVVVSALACAAAPARAQNAHSTDTTRAAGPIVQTGDVELFYRVYVAAGGRPTAEQLQRDYLDRGSEGLHLFARSRNITGARIAEALVENPTLLFVSAVRTFRKAGTPVPGNRPTTAIVRSGPYRFSRNPIYLAFSLLQIGLSIWVNSIALLITLIPAVALMSFVVIPREERYLEARFPSEYSRYKASVRRWV